MENFKVHEYTVSTGPAGLPVAVLGRVRPLVIIGLGGVEWNNYDGRWVNSACVPIDPATVPDEAKAIYAKKERPDLSGTTADTLWNCEFCPAQMPSRQYPEHLANIHIRPGMKAVATPSDTAASFDPSLTEAPEPEPVRPEDVDNGDQYEVSEKGYIVLNKDGSFRKKRGVKKTA